MKTQLNILAVGDSKTTAQPGYVSKIIADLNLSTSYAWSETPARIGDGSTWKTNMLYFANAYHVAFPSANIRLTKVWKASSDAAIAVANAKIDEMYAENAWMKTGINEIFLEGGDNGATYYYDTPAVHPNALGNALWATNFRTLVGW